MVVLTAFFAGHAQAESALGALAMLGVPPDDISVFPRHVTHAKDVGIHAASKAAKGATVGGVAGSVLGAFIGSVAGAGALVLPIIASVWTGPLVSAFAFAGAGGGVGLLMGWIIGARCRELEVRICADALRKGGALVAVRCSSSSMDAITQALEMRGASLVYKSSAPS